MPSHPTGKPSWTFSSLALLCPRSPFGTGWFVTTPKANFFVAKIEKAKNNRYSYRSGFQWPCFSSLHQSLPSSYNTLDQTWAIIFCQYHDLRYFQIFFQNHDLKYFVKIWISREESKEELVTKLEKEVYEPEMEEDEMEDEEMEVLAWSRNLSSIFEIRINLIFNLFFPDPGEHGGDHCWEGGDGWEGDERQHWRRRDHQRTLKIWF